MDVKDSLRTLQLPWQHGVPKLSAHTVHLDVPKKCQYRFGVRAHAMKLKCGEQRIKYFYNGLLC